MGIGEVVGLLIAGAFLVVLGILIGAGVAGAAKPKFEAAGARDVNFAIRKAGVPDEQVSAVISELAKAGVGLVKGSLNTL